MVEIQIPGKKAGKQNDPQVHDELLFDVFLPEKKNGTPVRSIMEHVTQLMYRFW